MILGPLAHFLVVQGGSRPQNALQNDPSQTPKSEKCAILRHFCGCFSKPNKIHKMSPWALRVPQINTNTCFRVLLSMVSAGYRDPGNELLAPQSPQIINLCFVTFVNGFGGLPAPEVRKHKDVRSFLRSHQAKTKTR